MPGRRRCALVFVAVAVIACSSERSSSVVDAGSSDGATPDVAPIDAGAPDAGPISDVGVQPDVGVTDTAAPADDARARDGTRVFVTSMKYDGNLGGLTGGDSRCQALADAEDLGGEWLAWLGDGTDGPATRFVRSEAAYHLIGGGVIANDWLDLVDGTIGVPIHRDETGTPLPATDDMIVWTAVFHTGGNPTPVNCAGWTSNTEPLVPTGLASATDTGWTVTAPYSCAEMHRLYCFEQ